MHSVECKSGALRALSVLDRALFTSNKSIYSLLSARVYTALRGCIYSYILFWLYILLHSAECKSLYSKSIYSLLSARVYTAYC